MNKDLESRVQTLSMMQVRGVDAPVVIWSVEGEDDIRLLRANEHTIWSYIVLISPRLTKHKIGHTGWNEIMKDIGKFIERDQKGHE